MVVRVDPYLLLRIVSDWEVPERPHCSNCFIGETQIAAPLEAIERVFRRHYDGEIVTIKTARGYELTGTPNHPIATPYGWIGLGQLGKGHDLFRHGGDWATVSLRDPHVQHRPVTFEEVATAAAQLGRVERVDGLPVDFHGDGTDSEVQVIDANGLLRDRFASELSYQPGEIVLPRPDEESFALSESSPREQFALRTLLTAHGGLGRSSTGSAGVRGHGEILQPLRFALGAQRHAGIGQAARDSTTSTAERPSNTPLRLSRQIAPDDLVSIEREARSGYLHELTSTAQGYAPLLQTSPDGPVRALERAGDGELRLPAQVALDYVIRIERKAFQGHVFNLQTKTGWYVANGVIVHNCLHAKVGGPPEKPTTYCAMGYGDKRDLWNLIRNKRPRQFRPADKCPDFSSMSDD